MSTATLVALKNDRLLFVGNALTLDAAKKMVGRTVDVPTNQANEVVAHKIEKVTYDEMTGDITAWLTRPGRIGGHHARIVAR